MNRSWREQALDILRIADPTAKAAAARALDRSGGASGAELQVDDPGGVPGRPERPRLVAPAELASRDTRSRAGRAALLHALTHIEFNAINLALDAVWRYPGLPDAYYADWLRVAAEEALHFELLREHLRGHGVEYGDLPAHDGLWEMARRTQGDPLARMALVPRTLEARGLDAAPPMQARLAKAGDVRAVEILDIILRDEIGHVAIGNHWYRWLCARAGLDPVAHYAELAQRHGAPQLKGPFNVEARLAAGFTQTEVNALIRSSRPSWNGPWSRRS